MFRLTGVRRGVRVVFCFFAGVCVQSQASDLFVSSLGSDNNSGTSSQPFRTISHAYSLASPGDRILVQPGVYSDYSSSWGLHLGANGTASSPIVLKSLV